MLVALTIAGSDSIGGAGLEADLKVFASLGIHGACVITAITSQNTQRVSSILPIPPKHVISQLDAVLEDAKIASVKTGMLYSEEIVDAIVSRLTGFQFPIVVDPVLVAGVGDSLHRRNLIKALRDRLFPIAAIVTPNRSEAEVLSGVRIHSWNDSRKACREIARTGPKAVLLKGGHFNGAQAKDLLFIDGKFHEVSSQRLDARVHGGGCVLSSSIAGHLARGMNIKDAVFSAKAGVFESISTRYSVGKGVEVVNPMGSIERESMRYIVMIRLRKAAKEIESLLSLPWVPEVGINFVYALPMATDIEHVCGLEGRITSIGGSISHCGGVDFGASEHVARVVLAAMQFDPEMRSAINLRLSEENLTSLESAGMSLGSFGREKEPENRMTMEWGTRKAIETVGFVPDAIFDRGSVGKEPMIRLLGRDPNEILTKLRRVLN